MSRIINRVIDNSNGTSDTLLDLTEDTVNADNLLLNETAHNREGEPIRGTHISGGAVNSVNGKTGDVVLNANDVGALPSNTPIPSKTSDLTNDSGYVTASILPIGGTTGQVLAKKSNSDYDMEWVNQSGSGGHTILNESGTEMPQRSKLQFEGAIVSDDETNNATVVETVNPVEYEEDIYGVNLIKPPYYNGASYSVGGITFVSNSDGTVTANGTSTSTAAYRFVRTLLSNTPLKKGETYKFTIGVSGDFYINFWVPNPSWQSKTYEIQSRTGELEFTVPTQMQESDTVGLAVTIDSGATVSDLTFRPMLRKATIQDDTYRPYNAQAIQNQLTDQTNVLGAKNLIPYPYVMTTKTQAGITFTDNGDGTITINGTATGGSAAFSFTNKQSSPLIDGERYIASNGGVGWQDSTNGVLWLFVQRWPVSGSSSDYVRVTKGEESFIADNVTYPNIQIGIWIKSGTVVNNVTVKPMLRLASDPDDTYVPYAKTNKELTEDESKGYRFISINRISVTADGVKTISDCILELCNSFQSVLDSLASDEFVAIDAVSLNNMSGGCIVNSAQFAMWTKGLTFTGIQLTGMYSNTTGTNINYSILRLQPNTPLAIKIEPTGTVNNVTNDVPTSGKSGYLQYKLYKKI